MSEENIGDVVLRLLDDDVTPAEVRLVLRHIRDRPGLRERCTTINALVSADREKRQQCFESMVNILFSWVEPSCDERVNPVMADPRVFSGFGRAELVGRIQGMHSTNPWYSHVRRAGKKVYTTGRAHGAGRDCCWITSELHSILSALEDLWGLPDTYILRSGAPYDS
jgi:hypothetical protein